MTSISTRDKLTVAYVTCVEGFGTIVSLIHYLSCDSVREWISSSNNVFLNIYLSIYVVFAMIFKGYVLFSPSSGGVFGGRMILITLLTLLSCISLHNGLDGQLLALSHIILEMTYMPVFTNIVYSWFTGENFFQKLALARCPLKNPVVQARECQLARDGRLFSRMRKYVNEQRKMQNGIISASDSDGSSSLVNSSGQKDLCCIHLPIFAISRLIFCYFTGHVVLQYAQTFPMKLFSVTVVVITVLGIVVAMGNGHGRFSRVLCFFRLY